MHPLKIYLIEHQVTLTEFASRVGVSTAAIHYIVNGKTIPRVNTAERIAEITGIPIVNLLLYRNKNIPKKGK